MRNDRSGTALGRLLAESRFAKTAEILAVFGVAGLLLAVGLPFVGEDPLKFQALVWVANVSMVGAVWLALLVRGQGWHHIGLRFASVDGRSIWRVFWRSLVVFVAATAAFVVGAVVMANVVGRPAPADFSGYDYLSGNLPLLLLAFAGVFVASSLGEEVLYRGFLITRLEELGAGGKAALPAAVAVSSILFGLVHFAWGPMGMVQTGLMGLALGVSYLLVNRNLWILVLAHFYMDAVLLIQMYLAPSP
jgi:membrane protease YdiL (CAAX protease family)